MSNLVIDDLRIQRSAKPDHRKGREGRKGKRKFNLLEVPLRVFARCWYSIGKILTLGAESLCDGNDRHQITAKAAKDAKEKGNSIFLNFLCALCIRCGIAFAGC